MKAYTLLYLLTTSCLPVMAQDTTDDDIPDYTLTATYKTATMGNPLSPWMLCADPTAVEYDGRLYVYGTNDQQEYETTGNASNNTYGRIRQLVMFSSEDLVNWTHHGTIDVGSICTWIGTSWAPSIASRVEADGRTHFYMYFTNSASGIGVMTSTSPVGPWRDPLGHALIDGRTPGRGQQSNIIDPGVAIDDNGVGWLTFGGGSPNSSGSNLIPGNARIVKLGSDMISLASDMVEIPAPYHFEANELNIIGDKFIFSYSSNWGTRNDWGEYKSSLAAPGTCSIPYMVSTDPLNRDSWVYKGDVVTNPGTYGYPWGNNHTHMQKFRGNWYLVYHTQWLAQQKGMSGGYRCIAINRMAVQEASARISKVTMTSTGAPALTNTINPYEFVQAETMANCAGVTTENYLIRGNTVVSSLDPGDWTYVRNIDFGSEGADSITTRTVGGSGQILVFADRTTSEPIAVVNIATAHPLNIVPLRTHLTGRHNLYFVFTKVKSKMRFDSYKFHHGPAADAIRSINATDAGQATPGRQSIYDLRGVKQDSQRPGINIINGKKILVI